MELKPRGVTRAHLKQSNIGEDYWVCDFQNYIGPMSAKGVAKKYLKDLENMKEEGYGILFGGPPGPGKTTIAVIILKYLLRAGWTVWMTSLGEIVESIQTSWDKNEHSDFLEKCREVDFLLIDDVGKEHKGPSGFSATVFDNLIRHRVQHRMPIFLTTNLDRRTIRSRYGESLLSLIEGKCYITVIDDDDVRQTVLKPQIGEHFEGR